MEAWIPGANGLRQHTKAFLPLQHRGQGCEPNNPKNLLPTIYPIVSPKRFSDICAPDRFLPNRLTIQLPNHTRNIPRAVRHVYHRVRPSKQLVKRSGA